MEISTENRNLWEQVADYLALVPSPLSGFDLFNYMGPMVFTRGRRETGDVLRQLISELEEHIANGTSTYPAKQEFRIFWEGIAYWPYLSHNLKTLKKYGINVVATAYARAWSLDYVPGDLDSLARAYSWTSSNNILIDESVRRRKEWNEKFQVDGTIYHVNRACKVMVGQQQELMRQVSEACGGLPYMSFDGDQADYRNFSEAQFETRVEAFVELMKQHKEAKNNG
jgi:benzoyl-CoA reductase/2-hydroxyglutaryl-CoA dehydratase subunit BcrC/BadD/HgdB